MIGIKKMFVNCGKATHICDKNQYKEASVWEKMRLILHLMYCRTCRKYSSKNSRLTKIMKESNLQTFNDADKNEIERLIQQELSK